MSDDDDREPIVHVSKTRPAYASPSFIIEQAGRYYVTLAVLEYDPNARDITPEQKEGVVEVQRLYREGAKSKVGAAELAREMRIPPVNTGPAPHH